MRAGTGSTTSPPHRPAGARSATVHLRTAQPPLILQRPRGSGCAGAPRAALGCGELCEGQRRLSRGRTSAWARSAAVRSLHVLGTQDGAGSVGTAPLAAQRAFCRDPQHRGRPPRRAAGRAKRRGMRMEASGCKRRADHQGNTQNSQQRQGETFGKNLQMQRLELKGFSASSRIALGFPGSAGTKRAPALFLGGSTCSNKTLFFSRVNVATAGCLGSLPGKKNKRSYRSEQMQRPNVEFSICEPDQREYHTCCDLQGKHVRGCNTPLVQVFQTKSPWFPNHHLWLRAS